MIIYAKKRKSSNWTLEQKKVEMLAYKWLVPFEKSQKSLNGIIVRFELEKTPINKRRSELLDSLRPVLLRGLDFRLSRQPAGAFVVAVSVRPAPGRPSDARYDAALLGGL